MNSTHIISQDVFDKIRSRFQNLEMGDEDGGVTLDPKLARFFDFDFIVEGKNLGRVSISINERGTLKVFYSQGILEDTNDFVKDLWYDFLREMRMFAKRRLLRFDTRDITKSNLNKNDFQYLAANGPKDDNMDLNESAKFEGSKKTSYRVLEKTKLIAKHKKSIENENHGARSRGNNIKALYIENAEGERYKYPFIHIAGAKAMQRHVANGGRPYDEKGQAIVKISEEILQLSSFKRHVGKPDGMNQRVNEITAKTNDKLTSLRRTVEGLSNQSYYEKWSESFVPNAADVQLDEVAIEDYKTAFTVSSFREDLMQYFPLIHKIMNEAGEVDLEEYVLDKQTENMAGKVVGGIGGAALTKNLSGAMAGAEIGDKAGDFISNLLNKDKPAGESFDSFAEWADRIEEGKLEPDTLVDLKDLLDNKLTLDVDGQSAIDGLEGIGIHDEELFSKLKDLADPEKGGDPKNDPKDTIVKWLSTFDPEAANELFGSGDQTAAEPSDDFDMAQDVEQDTEEMPKEEINTSQMPHVRKIAEKVYSHFNRHHKEQGLGPFPKGERGIYDEVRKDLGEEAGELAIELIKELGGDISSLRDTDEAIDPKNPRDYEKPAYMRRQAGEEPLTTKDIKDKDEASPTTSAGLAKRKAELGLSESDMDRILNLAGLKKKLSEGSYTEDSALDKQRDKLGSQGYISTQDDRLNDKERHNQKMQNMHDRDQEWHDAHHQSSLDRMSNSDRLDAARIQHEIDVLAHRLGRMQKDDDDWKDTFDMMRDRINRYQYSTQRDVDPEQLAKITDIKYKPTQRETNEVTSTESTNNLQVGQMVKFGMWSKPHEHQTGKVVSIEPGIVAVDVGGKEVKLQLANKSLSIYPADQKPTFNPVKPKQNSNPDTDRIKKLSGLI